MSEQSYKSRRRVSFSMSVKGVCTPDVTVEMIDTNNLRVIAEAEGLLNLALIIADKKSKKA